MMECAAISVVFVVFIVLVLVYWVLEIHYFLRILVSYVHSKLLKKKHHILDSSMYSSVCLTTDIDIWLFHMNNARYLREVDFARADFYCRTGLWDKIREDGGVVFQAGTCIRYRRFIKLFSLYHIISKIVYWGQDTVYMEHRFVTKRDNFVRAIVYGKQKVIKCNLEEVMNQLMKNSLTKRHDVCQKPECPLEISLWDESTIVSSTKLRERNFA